jgi:BirA family biotin operon repressor/biotin-[acetyl-CoA-carboxylase] ligase
MASETRVLDTKLDLDRIRQDMGRTVRGRRLVLHDRVASTNATLRGLAAAGAPAGTVVLAECQTAGRGRGGQPWFSPPGVNLYASVLLRPDIRPGALPLFGFAAGLAVADAVRELGLPVAIKWPNDVLVGRRKVAGTLAEAAIRGDTVEHVILGVGVNLNVTEAALREGLGAAGLAATSAMAALGRPVDRSAFAAAFLTALDEWVAIHAAQGAAPLLRAWEGLDIVTGRRVEVRHADQVVEGRARGVDDQGRLRVEEPGGRARTCTGGEVRLLD